MISANGNQDGTQVYISSSAAAIGFSFYGWGIGVPTFAAIDMWMEFLGYNSQNQLIYQYGPYHESGYWLWMHQWSLNFPGGFDHVTIYVDVEFMSTIDMGNPETGPYYPVSGIAVPLYT